MRHACLESPLERVTEGNGGSVVGGKEGPHDASTAIVPYNLWAALQPCPCGCESKDGIDEDLPLPGTRILRKLGVRNRTQAVVWAYRTGFAGSALGDPRSSSEGTITPCPTRPLTFAARSESARGRYPGFSDGATGSAAAPLDHSACGRPAVNCPFVGEGPRSRGGDTPRGTVCCSTPVPLFAAGPRMAQCQGLSRLEQQ